MIQIVIMNYNQTDKHETNKQKNNQVFDCDGHTGDDFIQSNSSSVQYARMGRRV